METKYSLLFSSMRNAAFGRYHDDIQFNHDVKDSLMQCNSSVVTLSGSTQWMSVKEAIAAHPQYGRKSSFVGDRFVLNDDIESRVSNPIDILDGILIDTISNVDAKTQISVLNADDKMGNLEYVRVDEDAVFSANNMNVYNIQAEIDDIWDMVHGSADEFMQWLDEKMDTDRNIVANTMFYSTILHRIAVSAVIYTYVLGLIPLHTYDSVLIPRFILQAVVEDVANEYKF